MSFKTDQTVQDQAGEAGNPSDTSGDQPFYVEGDRVFQTPADLIKSWQHSQQHIQTLETENSSFKSQAEEAQQATAIAEANKEYARQILDGLKQDRKDDQTDHASKVELNEDDIVARVLNGIEAKQTEQQRKGNMETCMQRAQEMFGENYKREIAAKANEIGMDMDKVDDLAKSSPNAFAELFIPKTKPASASFAADATLQASALKTSSGSEDRSFSFKGKSIKETQNLMYDLGKEYGLYD